MSPAYATMESMFQAAHNLRAPFEVCYGLGSVEGRERGAVTRKRSQSVCAAASAGESRIATCAVQICC